MHIPYSLLIDNKVYYPWNIPSNTHSLATAINISARDNVVKIQATILQLTVTRRDTFCVNSKIVVELATGNHGVFYGK